MSRGPDSLYNRAIVDFNSLNPSNPVKDGSKNQIIKTATKLPNVHTQDSFASRNNIVDGVYKSVSIDEFKKESASDEVVKANMSARSEKASADMFSGVVYDHSADLIGDLKKPYVDDIMNDHRIDNAIHESMGDDNEDHGLGGFGLSIA
jgi:hypothetical protein